jgi:hypothetical protein
VVDYQTNISSISWRTRGLKAYKGSSLKPKKKGFRSTELVGKLNGTHAISISTQSQITLRAHAPLRHNATESWLVPGKKAVVG